MALPPHFLEELRARTPLQALIGRTVRLTRSGRQAKGCCPFHGEKTPSFYVYEDHFHCFGCGVHGDAISFVMQSQGSGFMEAVEQLAAEAGLEVPKPSEGAAREERRRLDLHGVLDAALESYQRRMFLPEGRGALDYLRGRGLTDETIRRFGLGWSGEGRGALAAALAPLGITPAMLVEVGLMREGEAPGQVFDLFFNRVMFPIRDRRGRLISFGGRTLGSGQPKYVNGPETSLFSKRRTLYALDLAREAVRRGAVLLVVEGYMDVIALHQAGFAGAVAPLGTALTEEQIDELWKVSPEPCLCFDGDAAGGRAAARAADAVLPLLAPDRSLRFAQLSAGDDPDSVVQRGGASGFAAVLKASRPLSEALFDLMREGAPSATPEQRAAFRDRLETAAKRIPHRTLASEYRRVLLDRFFASKPRRPVRSGSGFPSRADNTLRAAAPRPLLDADRAAAERKRILIAILLRHPNVLHDVEHALSAIPLPDGLRKLRDEILHWTDSAPVLDSSALMDHLTTVGLAAEAAQALSAVPVPLPACASAEAMPADAEAGWWHMFGFLNLDRLREEVLLAQRQFGRDMTQGHQDRLRSLKTVLLKVESGDPDDVERAAETI